MTLPPLLGINQKRRISTKPFIKTNGLKGIVGGYIPNGNIDEYNNKYSIQVFNDSIKSKGL
jgi:hypothetical protein